MGFLFLFEVLMTGSSLNNVGLETTFKNCFSKTGKEKLWMKA